METAIKAIGDVGQVSGKVRMRPDWHLLRKYVSGSVVSHAHLRVGIRTIEWLGDLLPPGSPVPQSMPSHRLRQLYDRRRLEATDVVLNNFRPGRHVALSLSVPVAPQIGEVQATMVLPAAAPPASFAEAVEVEVTPLPFALDLPPVPVAEEQAQVQVQAQQKKAVPVSARPFGKPSVR